MMQAVFAQLVWYFDPQWDLTLGGRYEMWKTEHGHYYNYGSSAEFVGTQYERSH